MTIITTAELVDTYGAQARVAARAALAFARSVQDERAIQLYIEVLCLLDANAQIIHL